MIYNEYIPVESDRKQEDEYYLALLAFLGLNKYLQQLKSVELTEEELYKFNQEFNQRYTTQAINEFVWQEVEILKRYHDNRFNYQFERKADISEKVQQAALYHYVFVKQYIDEIEFIVTSSIVMAVLNEPGREFINEYILGKKASLENRVKMFSEDACLKTINEFTRAKLIELRYNSYDWQTMEDDKVREAHRLLNGKRLSLHKPHPPESFPGIPPRCRCVISRPSLEYV